MQESAVANALYRVRDNDRLEVVAVEEGLVANLGHCRWQVEAINPLVAIECLAANLCHPLGDDTDVAAGNESAGGSLYHGVAVVARVIDFVALINLQGGEIIAVDKGARPNLGGCGRYSDERSW